MHESMEEIQMKDMKHRWELKPSEEEPVGHIRELHADAQDGMSTERKKRR